MDYRAVLDDLQQQLQAGQARFEAWEKEKAELLKAMEAISPLAARQEGQLPMPGFQGDRPVNSPEPGKFRGLTYKAATKKILQTSQQPLSAPEIADILYNSGYASNRQIIKTNIDGIFKRLRESNEIERVGETPSYRLVISTNGTHG